MSYTIKEMFLLAACFAVVGIVIIVLGIGYSDCIDSGGDYVRGLFWMKCI